MKKVLFLLSCLVGGVTANPGRRTTVNNADNQSYLQVRGGFVANGRTHSKRLRSQQRQTRAVRIPDDVPPSVIRFAQTEQKSAKKTLDLAVCFAYFCNVFAVSLPIILLPMIAAERPGVSPAAFCAAAASVSALGAAFGKFINGFVCQYTGGRNSSVLYLFGMATCTFLLSTLKTNLNPVLFAMEFFASVQWVACSVLLQNHYGKDTKGLTGAISTLALSSTAGVLFCKTAGAALLQTLSWRRVAQVGSVVAIAGSIIMRSVVTEYPALAKPPPKEPFNLKSIMQSIRSVLGSKVFWIAGMANAMSFLVRTSDKVLGSFYQEVTSLPRSMCGGLTVSVSLGFVFGLISGRKFNTLESVEAKTRMWRRRYASAFFSALSMALLANKGIGGLLPAPLSALAVFVASAAMASSVSFQFYQSPGLISSDFGKNKAVCLSYLDCLGYLLAAPVWKLVSGIVSHPSIGTHGWSVAWSMIAGMIGVGGMLMLKVMPPILQKQTAKK